jgi:alpha-glucosidase
MLKRYYWQQDIAFKTTNAYGKIIVYSPSIIRVRLDKKPITGDFSYAVVGEPQKTKTSITQNDVRNNNRNRFT